MCNRICLARDIDEVGRHFGVGAGKLRLNPHWNIAAGAVMPVLRLEGIRRLDMMRWGLVTAWAQNTRILRTSCAGACGAGALLRPDAGGGPTIRLGAVAQSRYSWGRAFERAQCPAGGTRN